MYIIKLLIKNAFRHKLRTCLTVLSVAIAILSFGLLRTVIDAWYAGVQASSASRLVTRHAVSIILTLPISYKEKIRQIEGVKLVSYGIWFGGFYIEEKNFFANFAVEPKTFLEQYPEYIFKPDEKAAFLRDKKAFAAGAKLVKKYGWKIGDIVTLKGTIYPGNWEFVLRGIYKGRDKNTDDSQFFFHFDYLNEILKKTVPARADRVGHYVIEVTSPDLVADVATRVDKTFYNSIAETLTETEKAFQLGFVSMSDAIITALRLVTFIVIVIILAVVANTINMTARERIGEYSVFKTLGFGGWRIAGLLFGESFIITMMGCTAGIILTFPAARTFANTVGSYFPTFNVTMDTILLDITFSILVGILASVIPTWRSIKTPIADGLRRIG
ncbi:MAG: ABC transporter permease [Proteobacteria bacterium]|nr:ABC transporter permease [Pseudomonadota bacterium]